MIGKCIFCGQQKEGTPCMVDFGGKRRKESGPALICNECSAEGIRKAEAQRQRMNKKTEVKP